jgi:hypothetical protein
VDAEATDPAVDLLSISTLEAAAAILGVAPSSLLEALLGVPKHIGRTRET